MNNQRLPTKVIHNILSFLSEDSLLHLSEHIKSLASIVDTILKERLKQIGFDYKDDTEEWFESEDTFGDGDTKALEDAWLEDSEYNWFDSVEEDWVDMVEEEVGDEEEVKKSEKVEFVRAKDLVTKKMDEQPPLKKQKLV